MSAPDHYENFPVASILMPARLRPAVLNVYRYARAADDIADEGDADDETRLDGLARFNVELDHIERGEPAGAELAHIFTPLASTIAEHGLPLSAFRRLLSAFAQDVSVKRYADFTALRDYCSRSADPVGELMLYLYGAAEPQRIKQSDAICTALQLINFWQDVTVDWPKGRVYIPREDLIRFGVSEDGIAARRCDDAWRKLMAFEVERARALMLAGAPLARALPGRIGWELRLIVQGGLRILERIEAVGYDVFHARPELGKPDYLLLTWRALWMKPGASPAP